MDRAPRSPDDVVVTAITLAEPSVGPLVARTEDEQVARQAHLQQAEADFEIVPFDAAAARASGRVATDLRSSGRKPAAWPCDALIAAVALAAELPVHTANPVDFARISGLTVHLVALRSGH